MSSKDFKPYDSDEVGNIKHLLLSEAKNGTPLFFEVKVDGFMKIRKTDKVERFDELHSFLNDKTKELVINVYIDPPSDKKEWYKFRLKEDMSSEPVNGLDIDTRLNERMKAFEKEMEHKQLLDELQKEKEKIQSAEQYIEILENRIESMQIKPNHFGQWDLGKLAASTIEGIAVHYPKILDKVPVLNGIAKVIQEEVKNKPQHLNGSFEGDVNVKMKESNSSELDETVLVLKDFIEKKFDDRQRNILGLIIMELGENTEQLEPVAELLDIDLNGAEEETED